MPCADILEALQRAEREASKHKQAYAIYQRGDVLYVEPLVSRTSTELEIVNP